MLSPMFTLYTYFPLTFFLRILFLLLIDVTTGIIVYKQYKKKKIKKRRAVAIEMLVIYITFVLFLAVLGRRSLDYYRFSTDVLTYYTQLFSNPSAVDMPELVLNIAVFVPIGMIACFVVYKHKVLWAVLIGFTTSLVIELSQLLFRCGYVSGVDIIHNTLGTLIGALVVSVSIFAYKRLKNKPDLGEEN